MKEQGTAETATDAKKEQRGERLHRAIWAMADRLGRAVDGWDFKGYVPGMIVYRCISGDLTGYEIKRLSPRCPRLMKGG